MNLGALVASLGVDSSGLWSAEKDMAQFASNVQKDMSRVQAKLDKVGQQFQDFGKKATMYVTLPILAAGGYAFKMASDLNESLNKVDVAFKSSSKEITDWSKTTLTSFGIAQGSSLDMAALFGDMSTSMGLATDTSAKMSKSLVGLAGDLASFKNIGIEQTQTALAGIFTGETESLKRLGIVMTEINLKEYAMAQGITKKIDAMTQAEKVQLRYNYVLSVTKNAQGDFERTSGGAANQMRVFMESIKETSATFGTLLLPTITKMIKWVNGLMKEISALDETTKKWIIGIGIALAAIGPLAFVIGSVMKAFALLTTVVTGTSAAVTFLTAAIASNPWGLLITALAASAAGVWYYYNSVNKATGAQEKLNEELSKTQKLQNNMSGISDKAATLKDLDKPGLEAFQAEVKSSMMQVIALKNTSYDTFLNQDSRYLDLKEKLLKASTAAEKTAYQRQLFTVQSTLENELLATKISATQQLKVLEKYNADAEALKGKFDKVVVNQKVIEANAQAALSFQGLDTNIKLFGKTVDDNQTKLGIYTTQLAALKEAGITGGQGIQEIANRIIGLQSAIDMTKLSKIGSSSIASGYISTKKKGGTFDQGLSTASPEIIETTMALANMASVYQRVGVAQEQYRLQQEDMAVSTINVGTIFNNVFSGMANSITSALDSTTNVLEAFGTFFMNFIKGMIMKLVAAAIAAFALAAILSALGIGGGTVFKGLEAGAGFSKTFKAGFNAFGVGMANGGVVPSGYPNDSYPAMLTSGETVTPPDKLGRNFAGNSKKQVKFVIEGRTLVGIMEDMNVANNSF